MTRLYLIPGHSADCQLNFPGAGDCTCQPSVTQIAEEVYHEFANQPHALAHLAAHPTCEICQQRPSVRITRWGTIKAACHECLAEELQRFNEHREAEEKYAKRYYEQYGEHYTG